MAAQSCRVLRAEQMPRRSSLASLGGASSEGSIESSSHEDIASPVDCPTKRERRKAIFDGEVRRSTTANESVPIQLAQCRFPGQAICTAKILIYIFSNKIHGSNFITQHSETVMIRNYQNADCILKINKFYCVIYYNFRHTISFPTGPGRRR